ncbi:MAG: YIP1 family protein [Caldilineaceae bacterium]|nr:YIP1 family protein [Caldilineaceae bacterium]
MDLSSTWETWLKVTTAPNDATFEAERQKPQATLTTALIWMLIAGVVAGVIGFLSSLVFASAMRGIVPEMLAQSELPPEARAQIQMLLNTGIFGAAGAANLASIITVPLFFLIGVGIYHLIAKLLGGTGEFGRYAYLNAAYAAPLGILVTLLSLVPIVNCLTIVVSIYQLVLAYFATKVEHQLTSGKAILVILIPILVVVLLLLCFMAAIFSLIVQVSNN